MGTIKYTSHILFLADLKISHEETNYPSHNLLYLFTLISTKTDIRKSKP